MCVSCLLSCDRAARGRDAAMWGTTCVCVCVCVLVKSEGDVNLLCVCMFVCV